MKAIDTEHIQNAFNHQNLKVFNNIINFQNFLMTRDYSNTIILLMSSGNFGGFDLESLKNSL